jgi:hypothetical protein
MNKFHLQIDTIDPFIINNRGKYQLDILEGMIKCIVDKSANDMIVLNNNLNDLLIVHRKIYVYIRNITIFILTIHLLLIIYS